MSACLVSIATDALGERRVSATQRGDRRHPVARDQGEPGLL